MPFEFANYSEIRIFSSRFYDHNISRHMLIQRVTCGFSGMGMYGVTCEFTGMGMYGMTCEFSGMGMYGVLTMVRLGIEGCLGL